MIVRYSPLDRFNEFEKLFDSLIGSDRVMNVWTPRVDVKETNSEITFHVELPGMKQEDIDVEFDGRTLVIRGKREFSEEDKKENYIRVERRYGSFERTFSIGSSIKRDEIKATYKDGILTLVLPKANGDATHKIAIASGNN
jgi:HSP20 family protein